MKRSLAWLAGILVVLLAATAGLAQDDPGEDAPPARKKARRKRAPRKRAPRAPKQKVDVYAKMAEVLKLDEAAKQKFDEQVAANKAALAEWDKGDGAKLPDLRKASSEARKAKDREKAKELGGQVRKLIVARQKLETELVDKVLAVLTDEQKATWAKQQLCENVLLRFRRAKLTEEQIAQVQKLCEAAAKEAGQAQDEKGRGQAIRKLQTEVTQKVLTDEQREQLKKGGGKRGGEGRRKGGAKREGRKKGQGDAPAMGNPQW